MADLKSSDNSRFKRIELSKTDRSDWLDVLRGLAILGVVAVHSVQISDKLSLDIQGPGGALSSSWTSFISLGRYGVEVFFFLSGWLMVAIFVGSKLEF